ncbi:MULTISPECIES: hypothetical protein [unclassified Streptomyces]|uniref:hypothetical protein n=1 Tax=unclassified Streptomyces TaxID=2593676 RepID=UPI002B1DA1E2|nr:hypothetical protein [Streptomyces sp. NBC_00638]
MNDFRDSPAHVFVVGVAVAVTEAGVVGVKVPAGSVDGPVPPGDTAGFGEPEDEAAGAPEGEAAEPVSSSPGWHAVMRSAAAETVAIARAALRTRAP